MILAAAAATAPMAMAGQEECANSGAAYLTATIAADCNPKPTACPPAYQTAIDALYTDCGGEEGFDESLGATAKTAAVACGCSGAEMAAPVFALAAAAMAFFA